MEITSAQEQIIRDLHSNAKTMYRQAVKDKKACVVGSLDEKKCDIRAQYWNGKMIGIENVLYVLEIKTDFDKDGEVYPWATTG